MAAIQVGSIVVNVKKPEWGPGKVFCMNGTCALVGFRDLPSDRFKRLQVSPFLALASSQADAVLERLSCRFDASCQVVPSKTAGRDGQDLSQGLTFEEALARFVHAYPEGFEGAAFDQAERAWKWEKHLEWAEQFPGRKLRELAGSDPAEAARRLLRVIRASRLPLLTPRFEVVALEGGLASPQGPAFLLALADFLDAGSGSFKAFDRMATALAALPSGRAGTRVGTWPILTAVPFLAQPTHHFFLRPDPTREAARLLGFELGYGTKLNWRTYQRLLDLATQLLDFLRPHGARDFIDVQAFISVIVRPTPAARA